MRLCTFKYGLYKKQFKLKLYLGCKIPLKISIIFHFRFQLGSFLWIFLSLNLADVIIMRFRLEKKTWALLSFPLWELKALCNPGLWPRKRSNHTQLLHSYNSNVLAGWKSLCPREWIFNLENKMSFSLTTLIWNDCLPTRSLIQTL